MKITILSVGNIKEKYLIDAIYSSSDKIYSGILLNFIFQIKIIYNQSYDRKIIKL